jgi:predicted ATPase/DNA-binding CsgD family transcriptional regulator
MIFSHDVDADPCQDSIISPLFQFGHIGKHAMSGQENKSAESLVEPLTRREREVLALLGQGYTGPEIAEKLTLALSSVKYHVQHVYGKLGVNSKRQAVARARELGMLQPATGLPAITPPSQAQPPRVKHNLPRQVTQFFGREHDIAKLVEQIAEHPLVTLTGSGGVGKTRLSLRVAEEVVGHFADGVWLVELAALVDPAFVPRAVTVMFGLHDQAGRSSLETLTDYLRPKAILLLLDNCEHLIGACAQLVDALLRVCPRVQVLATSREGLSIAGELIWSVPSLTLPDVGRTMDLETVLASEAVRLFAQRAQAAKPELALTEQNAATVARICQRLDGIPLAIELAAARARVLTVEQIATRLDDRFRLLTGGSRTALERHQTLRAAMDWSYQLLSAPERVLLQRLAVFSGGWTLEAAESVCASDGVQDYEVLDLLAQLASKSLVGVEERGGAARYSMLETIRQYAREKLADSGEADRVQDAHLDFFLKFAEAIEPELHRADQLLWLKRLEAEHDNFRRALRWADRAESAEANLRLAGALGEFWRNHSHLTEGRGWLERALARAKPGSPTRARAKALFAAGHLAFFQGDYAPGRVWLQESMVLSRELGDKAALASSSKMWGMVVLFQGDPAAACAAEADSAAISRELHDTWGIATSLFCLGLAKYAQGDYAAAQSAFEENLALLGETGDRWEISYSLTGLGRLALQRGDFVVARARFESALALRLEINDKWLIAHSLNYLGALARREGDQLRAAALYRESLSLFQETGSRHGLALCLAALGGVAGDEGQPARAARLLGAAAGSLERLSAGMVLGDPAGYEQDRAALRAALGEAAFAAAWDVGQAMTLDQAMAFALSDDEA